MVQPVPVPADSNPRITWGKYFQQGGRMLLPVHCWPITPWWTVSISSALERELVTIAEGK